MASVINVPELSSSRARNFACYCLVRKIFFSSVLLPSLFPLLRLLLIVLLSLLLLKMMMLLLLLL